MQHYKGHFCRQFCFKLAINSSSRSTNSITGLHLVRSRSSITSFIYNPFQFLKSLVTRNNIVSNAQHLPPRPFSDRVLRAAAAASPSPPKVSVSPDSTLSSLDPSQKPDSAANEPEVVRPGHSKSAVMKSQLSRLSSTPPGSVKSLIKRPAAPLRELQAPPPDSDANTSRLQDFLDDKKNWGAWSVKSGRPWRVEELRLKSSVDLHRLWYVLLKERNMLMTMQAEYDRLFHHMPNPERFEKVEESMENLLKVVMERNRAVRLLETGKHGEPEPTWSYDWLGRPVFGWTSEHAEPRHANPMVLARKRLMGAWVTPYLRREREQRLERLQERWRAWKRAAEKDAPKPDAGSKQHARFVRQAIYK